MEKPLLPFAIATSPEPGITLLASPIYDCGYYETLDQLQAFLDQFTATTPFRCDMLNKLRDSFRARQQQIDNGRATHPLWDAGNGFRVPYGRLNQCAQRVGLNKYTFGYRETRQVQYGEPM